MQSTRQNEKRRVVVTGLGPITAASSGKDEFWNFLLSQKPFIKRIPEEFEETYSFKSKFYVPFPELDIQRLASIFRYPKIVSLPAKIAVLATDMALIDTGLKHPDQKIDPEILRNAGVIIGNGLAYLEDALNFYIYNTCAHIPDEMLGNILKPQFKRMVVPITMPDSITSWISIIYKAGGINHTLNASCSSGTYAIGESFRKIKDGYADIMITGGVECLKEASGSIMKGFDILGALTQSEDGFPMPFSYKRSGFLYSEGAGCILILEELEKAKKRGAPIYAEIEDFNCNSDAYNIVQIEESGQQIIRLLKSIVGNKKIDYINTHGTGTELNDKVECKIIKEVFGPKKDQPFINSTKSILGHSIGASGALEAATTVLSIKNDRIHANIAENMFDDLNLAVDNMEAEINYALSTSYGFGGHNAALLFKKFV